MRPLFVIALLALPFAVRAQSGTVSPGMNRAQVVTALGEPVTSRVASEYTYLFYRNDCGRACGMNDLVVLRRDSVVDAIFRSASRKYTGTSSSPTEEVREVERPRSARRARPAATVTAHKDARAVAPAPGVPSWTAPATTPAARGVASAARPAAPIAKPAAPAAKPAAAAPVTRAAPAAAAKPAAPAAKPAAAAQVAPATQLKPAAPKDNHPIVPAGQPPLKPAAAAAPAAPAPTRPPAP